MVPVQRAQGLDGADCGGGGGRGLAADADLVRCGFGLSLAAPVWHPALLALTLAVALPCSWLAVEMKAAREQQSAAEAIKKLGGRVERSGPSGPNWLRAQQGMMSFRLLIPLI